MIILFKGFYGNDIPILVNTYNLKKNMLDTFEDVAVSLGFKVEFYSGNYEDIFNFHNLIGAFEFEIDEENE